MNTKLELLESLFDAHDDCRRRKMNSIECGRYRMEIFDDITRLTDEIWEWRYVPSQSIAFCVTKPKIREVFAANYRDRVVQHWITMRLEPLFEKRFIECGNVSFNCRKHYGVQKAIQTAYDNIYNVSNGYTIETTYVGKYDLRSFFMSIDKSVMWNLLEELINTEYEGNDKDTLLYLTELVIFHCPQYNCSPRGDLSLWNILPPHKSLFNAEDDIGVPIGNITSQLFANFYMSFFDMYMMEECWKRRSAYIRFVDDFMLVTPNKEYNLEMRSLAQKYLAEKLHVNLHPDKDYLQPYYNGIKFLGFTLKPNRIYVSTRITFNLSQQIRKFEKFCTKKVWGRNELNLKTVLMLEHFVCSINSLLGLMSHCDSYNIRKKELKKLHKSLIVCEIRKDYLAISLRKCYTADYYRVFYGNDCC